jgi:hypothetical protein
MDYCSYICEILNEARSHMYLQISYEIYEYLVPILLDPKMKWQSTYDAALEQCASFMSKFRMLYK